MKKGIYFIITSVSIIILLFLCFLILKPIVIDPIFLERKKQKMIGVIERYYNIENYETAKNITESLLLDFNDDEEILTLLDKIIKAKNEKDRLKELALLNQSNRYQLELINLLKQLLNEADRNKKNWASFDNKKEVIKEKIKYVYIEGDNDKRKSKNPDVENLIDEGIIFFENKKYADAKLKFQEALRIEIENSYANAYLAASLFEENPENDQNIDEAVRRCTKAINENNTIIIAHITLGKIYYLKGLQDDALTKFSEVVRLDPNNYMSSYYLGKIYYEKKEYDKALIHLGSCTKNKSDFINGYYYLSLCEYNLGNTGKAKEYLYNIINLDNNNYYAYKNLADIYKSENNSGKAIELYNKSLVLEKNYKVYYDLAECYQNIKDHENALKNYEKSISLNPHINNTEYEAGFNSYYRILEIYLLKQNVKKVKEMTDLIKEKYPELEKQKKIELLISKK